MCFTGIDFKDIHICTSKGNIYFIDATILKLFYEGRRGNLTMEDNARLICACGFQTFSR